MKARNVLLPVFEVHGILSTFPLAQNCLEKKTVWQVWVEKHRLKYPAEET